MKNSQEIKYFLYVRRSQDSEDRQMASLEDQKAEMMRLAEQLNLNVVDVIEESQSAKKPGRSKFNNMIERIHEGEANSILCWKINRLARNPVDGGQISWLLQTGVIQHIQTQGRDYKPTDNVIMMAVELGMANQFVNDLSVDVKRGMRQKVERGWMAQSWLPIGYIHNKGYKQGEEEIVSTPDLLIVRKLFSYFLEGTYSVADIQRKAKVLGLRNRKGNEYTFNTFLNMLRNPMYMGQFEWRNESGEKVLKQGRHEAIITPDQYRRVQLLLGKRGKPTRVNTYDFPFRGPFTCGECGCSVMAEQKLQCICTGCKHKFSCKTATACTKCGLDIEDMNDPTFIDKTYYRCTKKSKTHKCSQGSIEQVDLAKAIDKSLLEIEIDRDFYLWAKAALKDVHADEVEEQREAAKRVYNRKNDLITRADNLVKMRADGEINAEQLKKMKGEVEDELKQIDDEAVRVSDRVIHWVEIADGYLTFAETASDVFNKTKDLQVKREIVMTLGSNLTIMDKKANIVLTPPLVGVKNAHTATYKELGRFEPKKALDKQGLSQEKAAAFSTLCAGQDSNLRRLMPLDLQSNAIDHSATDAIILLCVLARYLNIK
jgi:site-specific DNA recombinase